MSCHICTRKWRSKWQKQITELRIMGSWYTKIQTWKAKEAWIIILLHVDPDELGPLDPVSLLWDCFHCLHLMECFWGCYKKIIAKNERSGFVIPCKVWLMWINFKTIHVDNWATKISYINLMWWMKSNPSIWIKINMLCAQMAETQHPAGRPLIFGWYT